MKELSKKILRSAGILCAIGAVGGLVIAGVNVITAPIIANQKAEAAVAAYKAIFSDVVAVGDTESVSGKYVTAKNIAYKDTAKTQEIGTIYTGTASNGHAKGMQIMVGFSKDSAGATVYGKIVILNNGATPGYNTTVADDYVAPYNTSPSSTTLAGVKCGATEAATAIKWIVDEAKTIYEAVGPIEDIGSELKSIFANEANYDDPVAISGTYAQKYYAVYSDEAKKSYIGTAYRLTGALTDGTSVTLMGGLSGPIASVTYGKLVVVSGGSALSADVTAYNAAPSAAQFDSWTQAADGVIVKNMMAEAADLYSLGTGNLNEEGRIRAIFTGTRALGDAVAVTGQGSITSYQIAYSDSAKSTELGYIFTGTATSESFEVYDGSTHTATIKLAVGISGTAAAPILGRLTILSDDSFEGSGMSSGYVDGYNSDPSDTTLGNTTSIGATHSCGVVKTIVTDARNAYKALKA
jgi:hypothetical protein